MTARNKAVLRKLASNGTISDSEVALEISVGLESFGQMWTDEILPFIGNGGSELRFVEGSYGRGKTHLLKVLSRLAQDRGFLTCYTSCGTESEPFESLEVTYQAIAKNICWNKDGEEILGLPAILENLHRTKLNQLADTLQVTAALRNLCRAYRIMIDDRSVATETKRDLRELLMGNKAHRVVFRELFRRTRELPRPLTKLGKRNAGHWLRSLLALPRQLGFPGLVVFFDEAGADLHLKKSARSKRQSHMANLRNLIDHIAIGALPGCAIVYGVTHDLLELAALDYPALAQRIERTDEPGMWQERAPNPRAIWTPLDELTKPAPPEKAFFDELGRKLVALAASAGFNSRSKAEESRMVRAAVADAEKSAQGDSIRLFVKALSSKLMT